MAAMLTHGKRMLRASLKKQQEENNDCSPEKRSKHKDPGKDAEWWCHVGLDKDGFSLKYISDYKGYGVFTNEVWKKGDFLLEYFGERINIQEAEERERKYDKDGTKMCYIFVYRFNGKQECIDATCTQGRLCQYANDAYPEPPNCVMKLKKFKNQKPRLCLFAHRDINKGEELVYDYGDDTRNLWWRKKVYSDDDPFDLDKTYIPDVSSDYVSDSITSSNRSTCIDILSTDCLDMYDELSISSHWIPKSEIISDIANIHTRNKPVAITLPCDFTSTLPENMDITASLDTKQAGMSDTFTISATKEVDTLCAISDTKPSSPTHITTSALPCEEATILKVIANKAASADTASATQSDISNMTSKADFHCVQCERRFKTKGGFSNHVKSHNKVSTVYCKPKRLCKLCGQVYSKLKRHIIQVHKDCKEVKPIIENPGQQSAAMSTIRKESIFEQKKLQCTKENPSFQSQKYCEGNIACCPNCNGFYAKKFFFRHRDKCHLDKCAFSKPIPLALLATEDDTVDASFKDLLNSLRTDEVGSVCQRDCTIKLIGARLKSVCSDIRTLGRLHVEFKSFEKNECIESVQMFNREKFSSLKIAIYKITDKEDHSIKYGFKENIYYLLMTSAEILKGEALQGKQGEVKAMEFDYFVSVLKLNRRTVFGDARYMITQSRQERLRLPNRLPEDEPVEKLRKYTLEVISKHTKDKLDFIGKHEFVELCNAVSSRLTLFNARRGGEPSRLKIDHWCKRNQWIAKSQMKNLDFLSPVERKVFCDIEVTFQQGKGTRLVSCLIPADCKKAMDILCDRNIRMDASIQSTNDFIFPNMESSPNHVIGWDCIDYMCKKAGIENSNINATNNRARLSTMYAALDVQPEDITFFYQHMGHTKEVNENVYQRPLPVMTIAKVGLHLQSFDNVTNSAESDTPTNEMYPLSNTLRTHSSDNCYSISTNITYSAIPCEEATFPTGIANQAASADTASAPCSDISNMTYQADQRLHWDATMTKVLKDSFLDWINMPYGCSLP
ncbi:hypothetical protein ACJMK2_018893, partial [Sinanodonta woodiana]